MAQTKKRSTEKDQAQHITSLILDAADDARCETEHEPEPALSEPADWPMDCTVGPGLEGAIACESSVGYVNGSKGWLVYRGYNIFDLCAHSTFEEVCYLLLYGSLPKTRELEEFAQDLVRYRHMPTVLRYLLGFPVEKMNTMGALRLGTNLMRRAFTYVDQEEGRRDIADAISADEDSYPMERDQMGQRQAAFEFRTPRRSKPSGIEDALEDASSPESCHHLIAGIPTIAAAVSRIRRGLMPIDPDPDLGHAANFLYMLTGRRPTPAQERIMDVALILHADHGMNASTFATMVVASTLSDIYFSVGAGVAALNGPLHGGANEQVLYTLAEIGSPDAVPRWYEQARSEKRKIPGFGHRVYNTYDPRARVLGPLVEHLAKANEDIMPLFRTAKALEAEVVKRLGLRKGVFPNVDFYSGLVYRALGIPPDMFTPTFAVSRVAGWTARVLEYLESNRIFRPRAVYVGEFNKQYVPLDKRTADAPGPIALGEPALASCSPR